MLQQLIAIAVFCIVICTIMLEKLNRAVAAATGAVLLILTGVLTLESGISYIDFNTLGVLIGMMLFVAVVKQSGVFEYIAIRSAKIAKGDPWKIMALFVLITAGLSAFLDNVTTVLLIGPMTIAITRILDINPVPFLISQILASNIGGTATLIGDPPNIMIGSAAGLSFLDFVENTGIAVVFILGATLLSFYFLYHKKLSVTEEAKTAILELDEKKAIRDKGLMQKSIVMIILVALGFIFHSTLKVESCIVALTAASIMLIISRQDADEIFADVEWTTIVFFTGLFIVVGGLVEVGIIDQLANWIMVLADEHTVLTMMILLWASALLSSVLDNIPFVATLIPLVLSLKADGVDVTSFWWAISLGACLGGNGTLIGASANVVLSGISNKHGYPISFKSYLKIGFPLMLLSIIISSVYLFISFGM